ncbi:polymorphic toxin-type HINT domain-containing protein [Kitasatospora sp. NPDC058218]|uniref:polymorphic toxin-type HINT domain-containing protein n=1 Tax=Kitasatospora sp. NPDC058218 TaxID=3346385 RepID=UPI0036DCD7C6
MAGWMWLRLLPLALVAGLLGASPALATDDEPNPVPLTDRARVVIFWQEGGVGVKAAAEAALTGTDADVRRFLDSEQAITQIQDDQVSAAQIHALGGPGVQEAARRALTGSPQDLAAFLAGGWREPLKADQQVRVAQLMNGAGPGVREAGQAALNGTEFDVQAFLNDGQYTAREADDRVQLVQILSQGGPNTQAAARLAINGTADDIREFLAVGQHVARARDVERTSVAQLAQQAQEAGAQAVRETEAAKASAAQALTASALAKEATEKAAAETEAARNDTVKAAAAAGRAADAADRAGRAAQTAVQASRAATNSARTAASAASQAAYAAAGAAQAASAARSAAAAAVSDRSKAGAAAKAAQDAAAAAAAAESSATALVQANAAANASQDAAAAALGASLNSAAASAAADQAGSFAGQAGAQSARAKAAAAATRRHAQEAARAATAAKSLAGEAAKAASDARTLAASAAGHARAAAAAANEAAQHATEAAQAAQAATEHADAAQLAAQNAKAAVDTANTIQDLARRAEAEDLNSRTAAALEKAKDAKAAYQDKQSAAGEAVQELRRIKDEADRLATALAQPGADTARIATDGRKLALLSMKISDAWGVGAASTALSGPDSAVLEYLTSGRRQANELDDRDRAAALATNSELPAVRAAATQALTGDAAAVTAFLTTGQYQAAAPDLQVSVAQLVSSGGPGVQQAGRAALNGSVPALRDFLTRDRFTAQISDDQVQAALLRSTGGPEVQAAARIALESPPPVLRAFIETGQYTAARRDQLATTHIAEIQRLIAEASAVAAYAQQSAAEAAQAAAVARNAAAEANGYATQARESADRAAGYAADARAKAQQAEASANRAAAAAKTAGAAETTARHAEASAAYSARRATSSAAQANWSAQDAYESAATARSASLAAGHDAQTAFQAWGQAFQSYTAKVAAEQEAIRKATENADAEARKSAEQRKQESIAALEAELRKQAKNDDSGWLGDLLDKGMDWLHKGLGAIGGPIGLFFPGFADIADLIDCGLYALQKDVENAILSCVGAIPLAGDGAAIAKLAKWADKFPGGKKVVDFLKKLFSKVPGSCLKKNSFPAGTRVLMADGSAEPIEQVAVGEQVLATDPLTGVTGARSVEAVIYTPDDEAFTDLEVQGPDGTVGTLTATDHHAFWSESAKNWVSAANLSAGEQLRTPAKATAYIVTAHRRTALQAAYNLTVRDLHTYYVVAGDTPVLVHNECTGTVSAAESYGGDIAQQGWKVTLNKWGDAEFIIRSPEDFEIRGSTMFEEAVQAVGGIDNIHQINGVWNSGDLDANLRKFNEEIRNGKTKEEAAFLTFTGKMAFRRGFKYVEVDLNRGTHGEYTEVFARFRRG